MAQRQPGPTPQAPGVIARGEIPVSVAPENAGLEVRPFLAHERLSRMLPPSAASLAWVRARPGRDVVLRSHPARCMLIVVQGSATLLGGTPRRIEQGDVVTIPQDHTCALTAIGGDGLHAVQVVFRDDGPDRKGVQSLARLLERNEARAREAHGNVFFRRLEETGPDGMGKGTMLREVFRVFSNAFQAMLVMRQALGREDAYHAVFKAHSRERVLQGAARVAGDPRVVRDPILHATVGWFSYQVLNLDNAGKAVLHLVLETAHDRLQALARQVVPADVRAEYLGDLAGSDDRQSANVIQLLEGHHPNTYRHLERVLDDAWNVFDAMTERTAALIERERSRIVT